MKQSIRKQISIIVFLMVTILCLSSTKSVFAAANTTTVGVKGTYQQTDARSMLTIINDFRTGEDDWAWDATNTQKVPYYSSKLTYDYDLEEIAMQRAMELVVYYSHTRPNGESNYTVISKKGNESYAENIAIGTSVSNAKAAFTLWEEKDNKYSGQGHRRNMLDPEFESIGVAHVYYDGCHYWVQEFGYYNSNAPQTVANDSEAVVNVEILNSKIESATVTPSITSCTLNYGESQALPEISAIIKYSGQYRGLTASALVSSTWNSENSQCVTIENNKVVAKGKGNTNIVTTVLGKNVSIPVTVTCNHSKSKTDITKATLTKDGKTVTSCAICGDELSTTTIPKVSSVTISKTSYVYNGKAQKPSVTVKDSKKKTLKNNTDYTVTYSKGSTNVGTYTATVTLKGNYYSGSVKKSYTITPAKVVLSKTTNAKSKKVTVSWKKTNCTSYEIQYSTSSKFNKNVKTIKNVSASKTSYTISKLSKNKTYYVRVRAYSKTLKNYGSWSTTGKAKITK
jgi:uncharacterized protein YkwD